MTDKLSKKDGRLLLKLARENILKEFGKENEDLIDLKNKVSSLVLKEKRGAFVTLHKKGDLRGCIGTIDPVKTVWESITDNAKHAAFNDSRFSPLSYEELKDTSIEISILTRPQKLDYTDTKDLLARLQPDIDGVLIKKQYHSATFLPQVWKQLRDPATFLTHLCMKAGLSSNEWKSGNLDVFVYQVQSFEDGR
ncbi:MAG: AmmeMemoRadiSam system protein A [Proteobacteria bacterium]|nr:AmmeMemoRadiSam system protein A [Pseudomonadota bacterium]MBU1584759.1 AmmeMemoRadiSam system protein A [Pseudomonadota bacterium]MBU2455834.1 AmmeMemoRadiSam system protein A [Pseudomonadota bacterium]MBU2630492.1 AmmeMemoRadiSam system protein A [Pseudomonadota bacterium]